MRRIDKATVAGYYGSDSAGTFVTCLGVLATVGIAYDAYMPVMLAVMEIPGCLVALYLVSRLRHKGMDALGNMPDEPGYDPAGQASSVPAKPRGTAWPQPRHEARARRSSRSWNSPWRSGSTPGPKSADRSRHTKGAISPASCSTRSSSIPGLYLLFGGIIIGFISGLQGRR